MFRVLPFATADGAHNMAADEVLLESAVAGTGSLRFYGWSEATLSLGYFQPHRIRGSDEWLAKLPFVRRPTGGEALVHHHELTYALGLPTSLVRQGHQSSALGRLLTVVSIRYPHCEVGYNPPTDRN